MRLAQTIFLFSREGGLLILLFWKKKRIFEISVQSAGSKTLAAGHGRSGRRKKKTKEEDDTGGGAGETKGKIEKIFLLPPPPLSERILKKIE